MFGRLCLHTLTLVAGLLLWQWSATALPPILSASDTVDDATATLRVLDQTILSDSRSWCEAQIVITGEDVPLTAGDEVYLSVKEDDTVADEILWETTFTVTVGEAAANHVDRTFNCASNFDDDVGAEAEYYIYGEVRAANCDTWCTYDRPDSGLINADEVTDDGAEEDDGAGSARGLALGTTTGRIARDQDWYSFELAGPAQVELLAIHYTNAGRLDITLLDTGNSVIANGADRSGDTRIFLASLNAGVYRVRVQPRVSLDFNHYDIRLTVSPLATECTPFSEESIDCGNCGLQTRTCTAGGLWTVFGECEGEGVCVPGSETVESCGLCGSVATACTDECQLEVGECEGEGECEPEDIETESCGVDEERSRVCDAECAWSEFTECGGTQCENDATEPCYTGPDSARGVGNCVEGTRTCVGGFWGGCQGDVSPVAEVCDDTEDNDCDTFTDDEDPSCQESLGELGDPCLAGTQCEDGLICIGPPDNPVFSGGYCGSTACTTGAQCGPTGVCGTAFGQNYCLERCDVPSDCRPEYTCAGVGVELGCIPRCDRNSQCLDPELPICDQRNGLCSPIPTADPAPDVGTDAGSEVEGTPDVTADVPGTGDSGGEVGGGGAEEDGSTGAAAEEGCGCGVGPSPTEVGWWLVVIGVLVWRRSSSCRG